MLGKDARFLLAPVHQAMLCPFGCSGPTPRFLGVPGGSCLLAPKPFIAWMCVYVCIHVVRLCRPSPPAKIKAAHASCGHWIYSRHPPPLWLGPVGSAVGAHRSLCRAQQRQRMKTPPSARCAAAVTVRIACCCVTAAMLGEWSFPTPNIPHTLSVFFGGSCHSHWSWHTPTPHLQGLCSFCLFGGHTGSA